MRKPRKWVVTAMLVAGLAAGRALAGDDDTASSSSSDTSPPPRQSSFRWSPTFARMFQLDQPKPPPRRPDPPKKETARKSDSPKAAPPADSAITERSKAEAALIRRLEVCDKLKEIALRSNDTELFHRAEKLDEQARTAYMRRTANLSETAAHFESDEKTLDRHLSATGKPSDRLSPDATATAALGNASNAPAAAKEVSR
jgi:hypothetical protein